MIQNENQVENFVIVVKRGNEEKYIARDFFDKKHINCTIKPNKAYKFNSLKYANKFWEDWNGYDPELKFWEIKKMITKYELV